MLTFKITKAHNRSTTQENLYDELVNLRREDLKNAMLAEVAIRQVLIDDLKNLHGEYTKIRPTASASGLYQRANTDNDLDIRFNRKFNAWVRKVEIYNKFLADLQLFAKGKIQRIPTTGLSSFVEPKPKPKSIEAAADDEVAVTRPVHEFIKHHASLVEQENVAWNLFDENYYEITGRVLMGLGGAIMIGAFPAGITCLLLVNPFSLAVALYIGLIFGGLGLGFSIALLGDILTQPSTMELVNDNDTPFELESDVPGTVTEIYAEGAGAGAGADADAGTDAGTDSTLLSSGFPLRNKQINLVYKENGQTWFCNSRYLNIEKTMTDNSVSIAF